MYLRLQSYLLATVLLVISNIYGQEGLMNVNCIGRSKEEHPLVMLLSSSALAYKFNLRISTPLFCDENPDLRFNVLSSPCLVISILVQLMHTFYNMAEDLVGYSPDNVGLCNLIMIGSS